MGTVSVVPSPKNAPLSAATAAFVVGGLGNVAFSYHDGTPAALASLRYVLALVLLSAVLPFARGSLRAALRQPAAWLLAAFEVVTVVCFMFAASRIPTYVFVLIGSLGPVLVVLVAPFFKHRRLLPAEYAASALVFVAVSAAMLWRPATVQEFSYGGVVFALVATVCSAASSLMLPRARTHASPLHLLWCMALFGTLTSLGLRVFAVPFAAPRSTWFAALFIAVFAGGIAKWVHWWSARSVSPQLLAVASSCNPLAAILAASVLLDETLALPQVVFVAAALAGVVWLLRVSPESRAISADGVDDEVRRQVPSS